MSIFNETLPDYIVSELNNRQRNLSSNRNRSISTLTSATSWARVTSGVNTLRKDAVLDQTTGDYRPQDYTNELAVKNVLIKPFGQGNPMNGYSNSFNSTPNRHGIKPLPAIQSISSKSYSANGSLRTVTIKFVCWDLTQLDVMELLYMRPGFPICVEWGWSHMMGDNSTIIGYPNFGQNFLNGINNSAGESKTLLGLYAEAYEEVKKYKGNVDIFIGKIQNYKYTNRPDGGYDCETTAVSYGEILDSLKINYIPFESDISNKGILNKSVSSLTNKYSEGILPGILQELYIYAENQRIKEKLIPVEGIFDELEDNINLFALDIPQDISGVNDNKNTLSPTNNNLEVYIQFSSLMALINQYVFVSSGKGNELTRLRWYDDRGVYLKCASHPFQFSTNPQVCIINPQGWLGKENENNTTQENETVDFTPISNPQVSNIFNNIGGVTNVRYYAAFLDLVENNIRKKGNLENAILESFNEIMLTTSGVDNFTYSFEGTQYTHKSNEYNGAINLAQLLMLPNNSSQDLVASVLIPSIEGTLTTLRYPLIERELSKSININEVKNPSITVGESPYVEIISNILDPLINRVYELPQFIANKLTPANTRNISSALAQSGLGNLTNFFVDNDKTYSSAYFPNIYVNLNYIYSLVSPKSSNISNRNGRNEIVFNQFMRTLLDNIQNSLGNINDFQIYGDYIDNTIKIIDRNYIKPTISNNNIFSFDVDNLSSVAKNFSIKSSLFPEQSAIVAISAQNKSGILGYNNRGLVDYNRGLISRINSSVNSGASNKIPLNTSTEEDSIITNSISQLAWFVSKCYKLQGAPNSTEQSTTDPTIHNNILRDLISAWDNKTAAPLRPYATPIPVTINLDIIGLAGIKIGNLFDVNGGNNTRILPASFKGENILGISQSNNVGAPMAFLVKSINHEISNNVWTTSIEGYPFVIPSNQQ